MSRLAKKPIVIPDGVTVTQDGATITVKGKKGELTRDFRSEIEIAVAGSEITLTKTNENVFTRALWGTYASHLQNMIIGVTEGFTKKLIVEGVGYKVNVTGKQLEMSLGFSHTVKITVPDDLELTAEKMTMTITGIDKERVGAFAAKIRAVKKPEPYKGKGIRYHDEVVRRKQGKKSA